MEQDTSTRDRELAFLAELFTECRWRGYDQIEPCAEPHLYRAFRLANDTWRYIKLGPDGLRWVSTLVAHEFVFTMPDIDAVISRKMDVVLSARDGRRVDA